MDTTDVAKEHFRRAWRKYRTTLDCDKLESLRARMRQLQPLIADEESPEWIEFSRTLSGYNKWVEHLGEIGLANINEDRNLPDLY